MSRRIWKADTFFKKVHDTLLTEYWNRNALPMPTKHTSTGRLRFETAWAHLPAEVRDRLGRELVPVNALCKKDARDDLLNEAMKRRDVIPFDEDDLLSASHYDLAMILFLYCPDALATVDAAMSIDSMKANHEFVSDDPAPGPLPDLSLGSIEHMQQMFAQYLRSRWGAVRCVLEPYEADGRFIVRYFHEESLRPVPSISAESVEYDVRRPVDFASLVYLPDENRIMVRARRETDRRFLVEQFAEVALGRPQAYFASRDREMFDFDIFRNPDGWLTAIPGTGVQRIDILTIEFIAPSRELRHLKMDFRSLRSMRDLHRAAAEHSVCLATCDIRGVKLRFHLVDENDRSRTRTVELKRPNRSTLNDTEVDRIIRAHLQEWGIDGSQRSGDFQALVRRSLGQASLL